MNVAALPSSSCTQIALCGVFHIKFISDPYLDRYSNYIGANGVFNSIHSTKVSLFQSNYYNFHTASDKSWAEAWNEATIEAGYTIV